MTTRFGVFIDLQVSADSCSFVWDSSSFFMVFLSCFRRLILRLERYLCLFGMVGWFRLMRIGALPCALEA